MEEPGIKNRFSSIKLSGIADNKIFVALISKIVSVAQNGSLVDSYHHPLMVPSQMVLLPGQNKLGGLLGFTYTEINLATKELQTYDHEDYFKSLGLIAMNIGQGYVDGENIIFSSLAEDMNPFGKSKLAAFNTITQQIVWQHTFDVPKRRPTVKDGRIFVVDDNHILHIFERDTPYPDFVKEQGSVES